MDNCLLIVTTFIVAEDADGAVGDRRSLRRLSRAAALDLLREGEVETLSKTAIAILHW